MRARRPLIVLLMLTWVMLPAWAQSAEERWPDWRVERLPRIESAPDPTRITIVPVDDGWAWVLGGPGAGADDRARMVRIINLSTADQVAAFVRADGSFGARLFAPPGSALQINTNMLRTEDLPWELQAAIRTRGKAALEDLRPESPGAEVIGGHVSSSSATIVQSVRRGIHPTSGRLW